ncbi:MAG: glycoside hydrolase family 3 N-terminal domain-containing protein [Solirubrobacteraceae bacterium]
MPEQQARTERRMLARVDRLPAEELAGLRIIYAYAGLRPPESLLSAVAAGEAGGVIVFASNIGSRQQISATIAQLQRVALASPLHAPLLVLTDQEGGGVRRLPGEPTLSERQIGESPDRLALARAAGRGAGVNLAGIGINVNLAPVMDIYRHPGNFIDEFQRAYSSDPGTAAELGAAFIAAQQATGVAATAKHFPGLGAAARSEDTDLETVTIGTQAATLRSVDEAPFRAAIAAGVRLVMTSWAVYPTLDATRPAGLSPRVIQQELRQRLGFRGVTITDAIDAGALHSVGSLTARSILAADAGADLILCAAAVPSDNTPAQGLIVLHGLVSALRSHQLNEAMARQSAARILALRAQLSAERAGFNQRGSSLPSGTLLPLTTASAG